MSNHEPNENERAAQNLYDLALEAVAADDYQAQPESVREAIKDAKAGARFAMQMFRMGDTEKGHDLYLAAVLAWRRVENEIQRNQRVEAGRHPKRRWWADILSERVSSWKEIPESYSPLKVETDDADFEFYRDGDKLCCKIEGEKEARTLTRRWFEREYLKGSGEKRR